MEILKFCTQQLANKNLDQFEVFWEKDSSLSIEIKDGKLDHFSNATEQALAIRVLKDKKIGFSYSFDLSRDAAENAVNQALSIAELMPADENNGLSEPSSGSYPKLNSFDDEGLKVPLEQKIDMARYIEGLAKRYNPAIKRVRQSGIEEHQYESILLDSSEREVKHKLTFYGASIACVAEKDGEAEIGYDSQYSHFLDQLPTSEVATEGARSALELLGATKAKTQTVPVVFKPSVVAQLIGFLSASFSAENIDKKNSLLVGKKDQKVFSDKITLVDHGFLAEGIASAPFDGEGNPTQETMLIENGVVKNFLYNNYYAKKHGTQTTGNAKRSSIKAPPSIGSTNLIIKKGNQSLAELISGIKSGVFITKVMGLHTANPVTGEFSLGASGIMIENGNLTHALKGFTCAGNLLDLLSNVDAVGDNFRFFGSVGAASILVPNLSIGGA